MQLHTVTGTITRRDTGEGVHGLTVEAWGRHCSDECCLGSDLTNRDGSYRICVDRPCAEDAARPPQVHLRIRDRDGRVVHDSGAEGCSCPPGVPAAIDLALPVETLWWHLSRPLSWEAPAGGLVAARALEEIDEAIATLLPGARADAARCVTPPILLFNGLLEDAWATLQGDVVAAGRYHDALRALSGLDVCGCPGGDEPAGSLKTMIEEEWAREPDAPCGGGEPDPAERPGGGSGCDCCSGEARCPCRDSLVGDDVIAVLVMAALHVACGHAESAARYGAVILDQVCRLDMLGAMHRAAARALFGDAAALRHLNDLVELACTLCDDGAETRCAAGHPPACCGTCLEDRLERCIRDIARAWREVRCYAITDIHPRRACTGDEVAICGEGLGTAAGTVVFRQYGTTDPGPHAEPSEWCCDRVTVVVPEGAGCGLTVRMPADTLRACDRFLEYRPHGCVEAVFEGTAADILAFNVEGRSEGECVEPGTPLLISWRTCAADRVRVRIIDEESGGVIAAIDPAEARGSWTFTDTQFTSTTRVRVELTATGVCTPRVVTRGLSLVYQAQPDLTVHGVEVTQAIQHYRSAEHLTDPADRGPDNSLRLVTGKTAWVRAYLRSGQDPSFDGGDLAGVDGTLTVERRVGGVWSTVAAIPSQNGPVTARDAFVTYDAERGNIGNTLNFVVPATLMTGLLRLTVDCASPLRCPGNQASRQETVDVNLEQTLNAAFITIGYNGLDATGMTMLNLPAPNLATCQAETSWALLTYPVQATPNVRIAGTFTTAIPLDDPRSCPGCCSPNWQPLLQQVANMVAADQTANPGGDWVYYGIVAGGIPVNVPGCNWAATGGLEGRPPTYAHEIGHQFGLPHARCGNAGAGNAAYPVYEPYDLPVDTPATPIGDTNWTMASIGEYGLDINTGNIANPNDAEDFMSYCGPRWVSVFTHNFLVNAPALTPQVIPTGSGAATDRVVVDTDPGFSRPTDAIEPLVHMLGSVDADGAVQVASVARIETRYLVGDGAPSGLVAQLVDEDGRVLSEDTVYRYAAAGGCGGERKDRGCCDDCAGGEGYRLKAMLRDVAPGQALRIARCGEVVWERSRPASPPKLGRLRTAVDDDGNLRLSWTCSVAGDDADIWVRWAEGDSEAWHALTVGVTGTSVEIPAAQLPAGTVRFQVMAHDGFSTATATTGAVELPERPPAATILYPREGDRAYAEREMHLWGTAHSAAAGPLPDDAFAWTIDGEPVGRGRDIWVAGPGPGSHEIRLEVSGTGGTGVDASRVEVTGVSA